MRDARNGIKGPKRSCLSCLISHISPHVPYFPSYLLFRHKAAAAFALSCILAAHLTAADAAPPPEIRVMSYNVHNYFVEGENIGPGAVVKAADSKRSLLAVIVAARPDILVLEEMGGSVAFADLRASLAAAGLDMPYGEIMTGVDPNRHLAMLLARKPTKVEKRDDLSFGIRPTDKSRPLEYVPVQRGFLHVAVTFDGYELHIVAAHLKSKMPHPKFGQADMRRYEARELRRVANGILAENPAANLVVLGDLNDDFSSEPLRTLRGFEQPTAERLYDLRLADDKGQVWTHFWASGDIYGRIDYMLCSRGLLPEVVFGKSKVFRPPGEWSGASDHCPLVLTISAKDAPTIDDDALATKFPDGVRRDE